MCCRSKSISRAHQVGNYTDLSIVCQRKVFTQARHKRRRVFQYYTCVIREPTSLYIAAALGSPHRHIHNPAFEYVDCVQLSRIDVAKVARSVEQQRCFCHLTDIGLPNRWSTVDSLVVDEEMQSSDIVQQDDRGSWSSGCVHLQRSHQK